MPDGRIQGRWTQKWPSKISCSLGSQRPRKRPNSKFPNCGLILTIIGKNWPKNLEQKFFTALFLMISGVAGLRPNFLAELAQESWRDLAAVVVSRLLHSSWNKHFIHDIGNLDSRWDHGTSLILGNTQFHHIAAAFWSPGGMPGRNSTVSAALPHRRTRILASTFPHRADSMPPQRVN